MLAGAFRAGWPMEIYVLGSRDMAGEHVGAGSCAVKLM